MIKVECLKKDDKDNICELVFESRDRSGTGIDELDTLYSILMSVRGPDIIDGGYINSYSFRLVLRDART